MFALALPAMADIILGNPPNNNNCIPFSCRSIDNGNYEQIYNSPAFNGQSINIGGISFYDTLFNNGPNQGVANLNFSLFLATHFAVGSGWHYPEQRCSVWRLLPQRGPLPFNSVLSFTGAPYLYNPNDGNLELILETSGGTNPDSGIFTAFDANSVARSPAGAAAAATVRGMVS